MTTDDELRSRMRRLADTHRVAELSADEVMARGSSSAMRRRLLAVAAVLLLVMASAGAVRVFTDDGGSNADVASGADDESTDDDTGEAGDDEADDTAVSTTTMAPGSADTGSADMEALSSYYGGGTEWVVPWGDGFLSFGRVLEPSDATMTDLVPDIAERLPAEVIDALGDVTDVDEATALLQEVGLLDEATTAVMEDPLLYEAYNQVLAGGTYRAQASVSPDGRTWTVLPDFAPPGGGDYINLARSDGEHLALVEQRWDETGNGSQLTVHTTTDLTTWTSTPVSVAEVDLPDHVQVDQYANGIALGAGGWYLTVSTNGWVDVWSLIPEEIRSEFEGSYGWSADADGVHINSGGEIMYEAGEMDEGVISSGGGEAGVADESSDFDEPTPTTTAITTTSIAPGAVATDAGEERLVPWSELGITYAEYEGYLTGETSTVTAFAGTWDGAVTPAQTPEDGSCCTVIGTDAGFLAQSWGRWDEVTGEVPGRLHFSADGSTWSVISGPGDGSTAGLAAVEGGVLVTDTTGAIWRGAADGTGWTPVTIPELPSTSNLWFDQQTHRGVAMVIDVAVYDHVYEQVPHTVEFEHDGHELVIENAADGSMTITITEVATGEVVLDGAYDQYQSALPSFVRFDDSSGTIEMVDEEGEVVVAVPMEIIQRETTAALEAAQEATGWVEPTYDYTPDFWMVATVDGIDWYVEDLEDSEDSGFGQAAINGGVVVVRDWSGGWETIDIG